MKKFFKERLLELLHKDTLDSYRVKVNNTNSLFHELQKLIIDWNNGKIKKFETLKLCCEELLMCIKSDDCFSFGSYNSKIVIEILEKFVNSSADCKKNEHDYTLYLTSRLIVENEKEYLIRLFSKIDSLLILEANQGNFIELNTYLNLLVAELIRIGYAKSYLYIITKYAFTHGNFNDNYNRYKLTLLERKVETYHLFFKLTFEDIATIPEHENLLREVPEDLKPEPASSFFEPYEDSRYYYIKEDGLDAHTALTNAKLSLSTFLDKVHLSLGLSQVEVGKLTFVTKDHNIKDYCVNNAYVVDGVYKDGTAFSEIDTILKKVVESSVVSNDVKERLNSALRHFRLGNCAYDLEQKFINYWIGLEFIFSVPEKDTSTFSRIKTNLPIVLCCGYMKRNLIYVDSQFVIEKNVAGLNDKKLWEFCEEDFARLEPLLKSSLKKYRQSKAKSLILGNSDKRKSYLSKHEKFVTWHLVRLYRLRNELIHDAAIKNNIVQVTSNLRYYLAYTLNQLLLFFSEMNCNNVKTEYNINDFFYEYSIIYKNIVKDYDISTIISVPIELDVIK